MKYSQKLAIGLFCLFTLLGSAYAGLGNGTSPNPTGGFGSGNTPASTSSPNSTGSIGTGGSPSTLGVTTPPPPAPPPPPTPLDGGASILIAAATGLGIRKIYTEIKKK